MPNCTNQSLNLGNVGRRVIDARFDGSDIVSDGGVVLLRQLDQRLGLTEAVGRAFEDKRRQASVKHSIRDMLAQRIYGLYCGWEDVCDHNQLRHDLVMQTAVGRVDKLAAA